MKDIVLDFRNKIFGFFLLLSSTIYSQHHFKYDFDNVIEMTCVTTNLKDNTNSKVNYSFTYDHKIWRKVSYNLKSNGKRKLNFFINFDDDSYEIYNHKRAKVVTGSLINNVNNLSEIDVFNDEKILIGKRKLIKNNLGYILIDFVEYLDPNYNKEIQSIKSYYQYNCQNQLAYQWVEYLYFDQYQKYKRKDNESYKVIHCNPDQKNNFQDVYFYRLYDNILIKKENRTFKYVS